MSERTLSVDCGGTRCKAAVLDGEGARRSERVRVRTPYPCPPRRLVATVATLAAQLPDFDRVSVGLPGMIRNGQVLATPHYVTTAGPFTPARADLVVAWSGFEAETELTKALGCPVRVVNDAEMAGVAHITGVGLEVVFTLGTGFGAALFDHGRLLPKLELSQARFRNGDTFDEQLGEHARVRIGNARWSRRVAKALRRWHAVLWWDRLYLGGGNAKHLTGELGHAATMLDNSAGLLGGAHLWYR